MSALTIPRLEGSTLQRDLGLIGQLSAREREILRLIATGKENSEIAGELHISPRTVKNHVSSILAKLDVPSRIQAAVYAVRQGVTGALRSRGQGCALLAQRAERQRNPAGIPSVRHGLLGRLRDRGR